MDKLPYQIICRLWQITYSSPEYVPDYDLLVEIPKYFANFKYFKIKLKQCSCYSSGEKALEQQVWLCCDNASYNQLKSNTSLASTVWTNFLFYLTSPIVDVENYSYIMPYRDKIKFYVRDGYGKRCYDKTIAVFVLELEPYEI